MLQIVLDRFGSSWIVFIDSKLENSPQSTTSNLSLLEQAMDLECQHGRTNQSHRTAEEASLEVKPDVNIFISKII